MCFSLPLHFTAEALLTQEVSESLGRIYRKPNQWRLVWLRRLLPGEIGAALIGYVGFTVTSETFASHVGINRALGLLAVDKLKTPSADRMPELLGRRTGISPSEKLSRETESRITICVFLTSPVFHHPNSLFSATKVRLFSCCLVVIRVLREFKGACVILRAYSCYLLIY